jgi:glycogen operon protein
MEVLPAPAAEGLIRQKGDNGKINYWGYAPGYYFAPKQAYCATKDPEKEFRDLVKALHKEGMECIMEMYFPKETPPQLALRAVQFWKRYYHVDGFRFLGDGVPLELIFKDGLLSDTKLIASGFDYHSLYHDQKRVHRNLAECNYGFLQDMRRFLKSDEDVLQGVNYHIRHNPDAYSVINYMTDHDGFTLNDLVSYNYKHNEANGEDNADGSSYNYSWNCGIEGPSRRMTICQIRERQMKNAFLFMLLSQGVPMIYGGDEFGNSQNGNNNAYCQDNPIGWIDWKARRRNQKLWQFVKEAIAFRKAHPILHLSKELKGADYLAKGFPDISCHAEWAWYLAYENTSRLIGIMYCGAYAKKADGRNDDLIYVGYNFHWEERTLALPNLPKGYTWKKIADTGESKTEDFFTQKEEKYERTVEIGPRTMIVLVGRKQED